MASPNMENYVPGSKIPENVGALLMEAAITFHDRNRGPFLPVADIKSVRSSSKTFKTLIDKHHPIAKLRLYTDEDMPKMVRQVASWLPSLQALILPSSPYQRCGLGLSPELFPSLNYLECTLVGKGWGASLADGGLGEFISGLSGLASLVIDFNKVEEGYRAYSVDETDVLELLKRLAGSQNVSMLKQLEFKRLQPSQSTANAARGFAASIFSKATRLEKLILLEDCDSISLAHVSQIFKEGCMPCLEELSICESSAAPATGSIANQNYLSFHAAWPNLTRLVLSGSNVSQRGLDAVFSAPWFKQLACFHLRMEQMPLSLANLARAAHLKTFKLIYNLETHRSVHNLRHPALKELILIKEAPKNYRDDVEYRSDQDALFPIPLSLSNFPVLERFECHKKDDFNPKHLLFFYDGDDEFDIFSISEPPSDDSKLEALSVNTVDYLDMSELHTLATKWVPKLKSFELQVLSIPAFTTFFEPLATASTAPPMWLLLEDLHVKISVDEDAGDSPGGFVRALVRAARHMPQLKKLSVYFNFELGDREPEKDWKQSYVVKTLSKAVQGRFWPKLESVACKFWQESVEIPM